MILGDANAYIDEAGWSLIADPSNFYVPKILARLQLGATLTNLKIGKDAAGTTNDFGGDIGETLSLIANCLAEEDKIIYHLTHKWEEIRVSISCPLQLQVCSYG